MLILGCKGFRSIILIKCYYRTHHQFWVTQYLAKQLHTELNGINTGIFHIFTFPTNM